MLTKYGMDNHAYILNPIAHGELLCKEDFSPKSNVTKIRSIVGSLIFLCNTTPFMQFIISNGI